MALSTLCGTLSGARYIDVMDLCLVNSLVFRSLTADMNHTGQFRSPTFVSFQWLPANLRPQSLVSTIHIPRRQTVSPSPTALEHSAT